VGLSGCPHHPFHYKVASFRMKLKKPFVHSKSISSKSDTPQIIFTRQNTLASFIRRLRNLSTLIEPRYFMLNPKKNHQRV